MPPTTAAVVQSASKVRCLKCHKPLKAACTFRSDGNLLTCTNKVRLPGSQVGDPTIECGAKLYILVGMGPGLVMTALLSPEGFRELQSRPDSGDPLKVLEWLGLANTPLMPAA